MWVDSINLDDVKHKWTDNGKAKRGIMIGIFWNSEVHK